VGEGVGLLGWYSEATVAHPYSHTGALATGAHETGFLLGYIPSSVAYTGIKENEAGRRQSVAVLWMFTDPLPARTLHVPPGHREIVGRIHANAGIERELALAVPSLPDRPTRITVEDRPDHNEATLVIKEVSRDASRSVTAHLCSGPPRETSGRLSGEWGPRRPGGGRRSA